MRIFIRIPLLSLTPATSSHVRRVGKRTLGGPVHQVQVTPFEAIFQTRKSLSQESVEHLTIDQGEHGDQATRWVGTAVNVPNAALS